MGSIVWRVQDKDGRGPYKPGKSHIWSDRNGPPNPPFFIEMNLSVEDVPSLFTQGMHGGCGFKTKSQAKRWFTPRERRKLRELGYRLVRVHADKIIAETPTQIVFESAEPLSTAVIND